MEQRESKEKYKKIFAQVNVRREERKISDQQAATTALHYSWAELFHVFFLLLEREEIEKIEYTNSM